MNFLKSNFQFLIIIICLLLIYLSRCNNFGRNDTNIVGTKTDTMWILTQGDTTYIPVPHKVTNTIYTPLYKTDTLEITEVLPTDTAAIINKFFQKAYYSDTQQINKYGRIVINDTVYRNRILSRGLVTDIKVPEVTNTVTIEQKKNKVFIGASVIGTPTTPIYAVGGDLSLQDKTDKMYSLGAFSNVQGNVWYQAGLKVPIRLRKRKN